MVERAPRPRPAMFNPGVPRAPMQPSKKKDNLEYQITGDRQRDANRKVIYDIFAAEQEVEGASKSPAEITQNLEEAIFAKESNSQGKQYRDLARNVQTNLKGPRF